MSRKNLSNTTLRRVSFHPLEYNLESIGEALCRCARQDSEFFSLLRKNALRLEQYNLCEGSELRTLEHFARFIMVWNILQIEWRLDTREMTFFFAPITFKTVPLKH